MLISVIGWTTRRPFARHHRNSPLFLVGTRIPGPPNPSADAISACISRLVSAVAWPKKARGEATAALHHSELGDIDLVYGKEGTPSRNYKDGFGLAKMAIKHPEILDHLQDSIENLPILSRSENRAVLGDAKHRAIVSLEHLGKAKRWLLTAYREEGEPAANGGRIGVTERAEPEPNPSGQEADSAPIVDRNPSAGKNETLYQGGGDRRKARNLEAARVQGEMVKGAPEDTRGWFRVRPDGSAEIGRTKIGDFSTFIHEPAHGYLELFRTMTQRADASEQLKGDFSKICEWLGTTPEEVYKNGFTREQHEQWARANEQYVREGKAPSAGVSRDAAFPFHDQGCPLLDGLR